MCLNVVKCSIITFSKKKDNCQIPVNINSVVLTQQDNVNDLRAWFDSKLNFTFHYDHIVTKVHRLLDFVKR